MNIVQPGQNNVNVAQAMMDLENAVRELGQLSQNMLHVVDVILQQMQAAKTPPRIRVLQTVLALAQHLALMQQTTAGHFNSYAKLLTDLDVMLQVGGDIGPACVLRGVTYQPKAPDEDEG